MQQRTQQRWYADEKKPEQTEQTPPKPDATMPPTGTAKASTGPSAAPKKKKGRIRRFLLSLFVLSALAYAGGVFYSLKSDNFHDFFTEYVPFGEDAVAYLEEREFRRRFPGKGPDSRLHQQVRGENKITIPSKSGLSWRIAKDEEEPQEGQDLAVKGRHLSAIDDNKPMPSQPSPLDKQKDADARKKEEVKKEEPSSHALLPKNEKKPEEKSKPEAPAAPPPAPAEPAAPSSPASLIDASSIPENAEPTIQEVVTMLNSLISVINDDNAGGKYHGAITAAKERLSTVASSVSSLKSSLQSEADAKMRKTESEFDEAAQKLVRRLEADMHDLESRWKEEYESEREKLANSYAAKLKAEIDAQKSVHEQTLKNELTKQAIALQRHFTDSVAQRVEQEREGRLSRLAELETEIRALESLTKDSESVIDRTLQTQHLQVALDAVREAALDATNTHPQPFVTQLAALKEVAAADPVVDAAIASMQPQAYQRGIPTPGMLVDRFRRVAAEVRKAALLPEDAGVASHAASVVLSKVMFHKGSPGTTADPAAGAKGLPVGEDTEAKLARAEMWLEEGNLDAAAREVNTLNGWAKVLCRDWLADVRKVLEVRQALDVISAEARLQSLLVD
ncbi:mitochondrial inner membrane protein Mitofilin [Lineolata rhizophorae]|uniref:MICOS complex subunit MIC60 n=1 Tax=Lineolata rhizophorae TaxID=578093 RepID=A0A6A6NS06_9PEZI|nr:mitochondrial inner membrane protein Mitofilin [Lineolata rhizophorae]